MMNRALTLVALLLISGISLGLAAQTPKQWTPKLGRAPVAGDEYTNPRDGTVLVYIPGGEFTMGNDSGDEDEKPAHKQKVAGFWLSKYEVTNEQYSKFMNAQEYPDPAFMDDADFNKPKQPVIGVKFGHAQAYCTWVGLRMPTEAEWEFAAAGGKQFAYPTADGKISHDLANYLGKGGKDIWEDVTAPVGSFPPNPYGVYDLAGNAWEWTSSLYRSYPYNGGDGRENISTRGHRVMRGGSFHFGDRTIRVSHRHHFAMHLRLDFVGIRLAASTADLK
ncbi:MAG: SUMF1/EgtB/PvdO family nonheme iron enzyme [Leptospirales bacterium]|nr:SUMF1/EgtB/PvdO family nonheme iron enzyme [Leptospirales bacterium]